MGHATRVGNPYCADGNAGQLDHLALQELEAGVAQVLARQLLENGARAWSRDAQHADLIRDVADADVVAAVRRLRLDPPEGRCTYVKKNCFLNLSGAAKLQPELHVYQSNQVLCKSSHMRYVTSQFNTSWHLLQSPLEVTAEYETGAQKLALESCCFPIGANRGAFFFVVFFLVNSC